MNKNSVFTSPVASDSLVDSVNEVMNFAAVNTRPLISRMGDKHSVKPIQKRKPPTPEQKAAAAKKSKLEGDWKKIKRDMHGQTAREPRDRSWNVKDQKKIDQAREKHGFGSDKYNKAVVKIPGRVERVPGRKAYPKQDKPFPEGLFETNYHKKY